MDEKRLKEIIDNFVKHTKQDEDGGKSARKEFAELIESYFDELCSNDYFGTEGQCHPFGDKRG